jgi:hypothetical protein
VSSSRPCPIWYVCFLSYSTSYRIGWLTRVGGLFIDSALATIERVRQGHTGTHPAEGTRIICSPAAHRSFPLWHRAHSSGKYHLHTSVTVHPILETKKKNCRLHARHWPRITLCFTSRLPATSVSQVWHGTSCPGWSSHLLGPPPHSL